MGGCFALPGEILVRMLPAPRSVKAEALTLRQKWDFSGVCQWLEYGDCDFRAAHRRVQAQADLDLQEQTSADVRTELSVFGTR